MTNQDFIYAICDFYKESRKLMVNPGDYNIWRGVSHSISSQSEDLFALFIAEKLNDPSLEFIVDQTMSYKTPGKKSGLFWPSKHLDKCPSTIFIEKFVEKNSCLEGRKTTDIL